MKRTALTFLLNSLLCAGALAQGAATTHEDSESGDAKRSRDMAVEQGGGNWIARALSAHGSPRTQDCVERISTFFGAKASKDPWALPSTADDTQWRDASECAFALNLLSSQLVKQLNRPGILPDPASPAAAQLVSVSAVA